MKSFVLENYFPVSPEELYNAWLDSDTHTKMTGGPAKCSNEVNGTFSTWDGYIKGFNKELVPNQRIVQSWRTSEFKEGEPDSNVVINFAPKDDGCIMVLEHTDIPDTQESNYEQGWMQHYFEPMSVYFQEKK